MALAFEEDLRDALAAAVGPDGGIGWHPGEAAEPEPTALGALALGDERCVRWLLDHQDPDGGFALQAGSIENVAPTALGALALPDGEARERAVDRTIAAQAARVESRGDYPLAWGWTTTTYSWVEPTSRVLLVARRLRPEDRATIDEAVASLTEREVDGGGWNYGNADVRGTDLKSYAQTTACALIGLHAMDLPIAGRAADAVIDLAPAELGGLSLAQSVVALRLHGRDDDAEVLRSLLASAWERTRFLGDQGALAWAVLATGDGVERLRVAT